VPDGDFSYDVASIKPHQPIPGERPSGSATIDGYRLLNVPLRSLIFPAYAAPELGPIDVVGGPPWLSQGRYDFEGKYSPDVADAMHRLSRGDAGFVFREQLHQVLSERMHLVAHLETREGPAYDMVVAKDGLRLQTTDLTSLHGADASVGVDASEPGVLVFTANAFRMASLAQAISSWAGRPVFDKTGLTGAYDFTLRYRPEQPLRATAPDGSTAATSASSAGGSGANAGGGAAASGTGNFAAASGPSGGPTIFDAVEKLGLKLVPYREPQTVVVIDHIDRPSPN
jgi:uncharacterized protein (TIGR03435 family)